MANQKISALTALTGANTEQLADVLPIVDNSAGQTKKILVSELGQALFVIGTEQATTAGTSIDFTGIPAWVKRITINFAGVSTNGTSNPLIQIGDSGGVETSNYLGASSQIADSSLAVAANYTAGFGIASASAGATLHGSIVLILEDAANFTWIASGILANSASASCFVTGGSKSTSAALDRVRITTANGSDTFDAGAINITSE